MLALLYVLACHHTTPIHWLKSDGGEPIFVMEGEQPAQLYGECAGEHTLDLTNDELRPQEYVGGSIIALVYRHELADEQTHFVSCLTDWKCPEGTTPSPHKLAKNLCVDRALCCDLGLAN